LCVSCKYEPVEPQIQTSLKVHSIRNDGRKRLVVQDQYSDFSRRDNNKETNTRSQEVDGVQRWGVFSNHVSLRNPEAVRVLPATFRAAMSIHTPHVFGLNECSHEIMFKNTLKAVVPHLGDISLYHTGSDTSSALFQIANVAVNERNIGSELSRIVTQQAVVSFPNMWIGARGPLAGNSCNIKSQPQAASGYVDYSRWICAFDIFGNYDDSFDLDKIMKIKLDNMKKRFLPGEEIGIILIELVSGQTGKRMQPRVYKYLVGFCAVNGIYLVVDEIITGLTCGSPFLHQHDQYAVFGGLPNFVLFGKAMRMSGIAAVCTTYTPRPVKRGERKRNRRSKPTQKPGFGFHHDHVSVSLCGLDAHQAALFLSPFMQPEWRQRHAARLTEFENAFKFGLKTKFPDANVDGCGLLMCISIMSAESLNCRYSITAAAGGQKIARYIFNVEMSPCTLLTEVFGLPPDIVREYTILHGAAVPASSVPT
jgi:hypothetical protein